MNPKLSKLNPIEMAKIDFALRQHCSSSKSEDMYIKT